MKKLFKHIYLEKRFFIFLVAVIGCFLLSFILEDLMIVAKSAFYIGITFLLLDVILLFFSKGSITAERVVSDKLSNGDENPIQLQFQNQYLFSVKVKIIDELPFQFQKRDFEYQTQLKTGEKKFFKYTVRPTERGVYSFGNLNIFASSPVGFLTKEIHL